MPLDNQPYLCALENKTTKQEYKNFNFSPGSSMNLLCGFKQVN